jgi:DNA-binding Lrp family transcriptional regulator
MPEEPTELEKQVMAAIQQDIPIAERPYMEMADQLGITENRMIEVLEDLCRRGVIRRFGATLRHQKSGFQANAMTAWQVDEDRIENVGRIMAASPHVSHCYRRNPAPDWPGVETYSLLFSRRELKKTSMKYFSEDEEA